MRIILFMVMAIAFAGPSNAGALKKAELQAAMQQYVERSLVDGAVLDLDLETGQVQKLYPVKTHPMILMMGKNYVLCITLSDAEGNEQNADFYIAPHEGDYMMLRREIGNRDALMKLMKAGKVKRLK